MPPGYGPVYTYIVPHTHYSYYSLTELCHFITVAEVNIFAKVYFTKYAFVINVLKVTLAKISLYMAALHNIRR